MIPFRYSAILMINIVAFTSCNFYHSKMILKVKIDKANNYVIKRRPLDAGCRLLFYNAYQNNKLTEQFCIEYICDLFIPTKYVFSYDSVGNIKTYKQLVSVFDSSYSIGLTELDKSAFAKLEVLSSNWTNKKININQIRGFKEATKKKLPFIPVEIVLPK